MEKQKIEMSKEQVIAKVSAMPKITNLISKVTDKKGREWIVVKTVFEKWYSKKYFDAVMAGQSKQTKPVQNSW